MTSSNSRRDFFGKAFGVVAGVGVGASLIAMKKTWDPLPSVRAAGFTTVDISNIKEGVLNIVQWRGKPIFILKHKKSVKHNEKRDVIIGDDRYTIVVGSCTHLGCIPTWEEKKEYFLCACHGGKFDIYGNNIFGPPPTPLLIPPFKIDSNTIVLGQKGEEYKKLIAKA